MLGRKIVFKTKSSPKKESSKRTGSSDRSLYQASQSLKTTAAAKRPRESDQDDVILILQHSKCAKGVPSISEAALFEANGFRELTRMKPKSIPDRFTVLKSKSDVTGEVFRAISELEQQSAAVTPLEKSSSLPRQNSALEGSIGQRPSHKSEDKQKSDAFDAILEETFITLLELKSLIKQSPVDKEASKLEGKLMEYSSCLRRLKEQTMTAQEEDEKRNKNSVEIPKEVLDSLEEGINPDWKLIENTESLLQKAEENLKTSMVIEKFLNVRQSLLNTKFSDT
eukprot:g2468.t1